MRKFRSPHSLLFGIAVGIFLGLCISLLNKDIAIYIDFPEKDIPKVAFFTHLPSQFLRRNYQNEEQQQQVALNIWLRCVILLGFDELFLAEKSFVAVRDTWARKCNETLFFTDSPKLQHRYGGHLPPSMRILLIQQISTGSNVKLRPREWTFVGNLIKFLLKMDQNGGGNYKNDRKMGNNWTVVTDGRSYVHSENLLHLLTQVDENASIIVGRKVQNPRGFWHSILSRLFPLSPASNWPLQFSLSSGESPLIFGQHSLRLLAAHCSDTFQWSNALINAPRHAGRVIGGCALRLGITLWDPVDQESRPLIVDNNLKFLFSRIAKNATANGRMMEQQFPSATSPQLATCCSDRAIAFALLNHKEQRLIDFGVHRLKVFGR